MYHSSDEVSVMEMERRDTVIQCGQATTSGMMSERKDKVINVDGL